jgi:glucose-6-phosphate-specific signal transduction histidine kinase
VCVADNGTGLATSNMPGLGFTGMRERVDSVGRWLWARTGKGLIVTARLPCAMAKEAA